MSDTSNEKDEKVQIEGVIDKDHVIVGDPQGISEFYEGSYIGTLENADDEAQKLFLSPIEVLLLTERRRLLLWQQNDPSHSQCDFNDLLTYFSQFDERLWHKYIIYMDLRKRGYIVRTGYGDGIDFRVFRRGADYNEEAAKFLIYPVFEGDPIELRDLDKISRVAMAARKDLIIATVDTLSKVVYYSVKKFEILNKDVIRDDESYDR